MFKFFSLLKLPKHRQFDYQPRYYDEQKEELEARIKRRQSDNENIRAEERLRSGFRQRKTEKKKIDWGQSIFILAFSMAFVGYFYFGNVAVWGLGIFLAVYIYVRRRLS